MEKKMNYSYAVTSKGEVVVPEGEAVKTIPVEDRLWFLDSIREKYGEFLKENGKNAVPMYYMVQKNGVEEKILYFTKLQLNAASEAVRESAKSKGDANYAYPSPAHKALYNSIFNTEDKEKTLWWLLKVNIISFRHNYYDSEIIQIRKSTPVYYDEFLQKGTKQFVENNPLGTYTFFGENGEIPFPDAKTALLGAVENTDKQEDEISKRFVNDITLEYEVNKCDPYSNQAMSILHRINDCGFEDRMYNIYIPVKKMLKRTFDHPYGIYYRRNRQIDYVVNDERHTLYVSGNLKNPIFIFDNGNICLGLEELKKCLTHGFGKEPEWFREKVKPYIKPIEKQKTQSAEFEK